MTWVFVALRATAHGDARTYVRSQHSCKPRSMRNFLFLTALLAATALTSSALDVRDHSSLRTQDHVGVVAKLYKHMVKPRNKHAKWSHATYRRRPYVKGPKGAPNGGAVSMIGSGEAGERLIVKCSHKICTEPTKVVYFKNDGSKTESKSLSVNQDFTLDLIPNYAVDFGSGKEDTIVRLMSRNSEVPSLLPSLIHNSLP